MTEQESVLGQGRPQREWLVRCTDKTYELGVCSLEVNDGKVELISPNGDITTLDGKEILHFRAGLNAAIQQAETDIQQREATTA